MQLLDRYLTAVKFWLPKKQRDDIAAELAANLQAEIDDRTAEIGRPLTDAEVAAIVAEVGAKGPADMGKVMGAAKARLAGKADMALVSTAVKKALAP